MGELPTKMRGVWLTGHGGFEKLEIRDDLPVPQPGPRDVLIQISAAAVNNTDINTRVGWYSKQGRASADAAWTGTPMQFPRIQGADACGRIVAVGAAISPDRIGQRVLVDPCLREVNGHEPARPWYFGSDCDGAFAEYAVVASNQAHAITSALGDVELASFPCSYSAAENMLTRARVAAGEIVLVTGASGGVGSAAVQLARARGADVIAVTSPAKAPSVLALGAGRTLARDEHVVAALGRDSVDVVVDLVGGERWPGLLDVLRPGGRYAVAGAIAGPLVELDLRTLYLKDLSLFGCTMFEPQVFANLIRHVEQGSIAPLVDRTFPLEQIAAAQVAFLTKQHIGKIVLTLQASDDEV